MSQPENALALGLELQAASQTRELRHFPAGQIIFQYGEPGDGFYVIEAGTVRISAPMSGGGESRMLATLGAGDTLGEMAVLDNVPRSATARAETDVTAWFLSREDLLSLLEIKPAIALNLIREFSRRMRALNQKYLDEIVQAERLAVVGRFAGTIVHDFKNPLNVIGLAAEIASGEHTSPALRKKAQTTIHTQMERMTDLLQELIEFVRPTGQRRSLVPADFAAFMHTLAEEVRPELSQRQVELVFVSAAPAVQVRLDAKRLARLFYNLFNNAADAMSGGGKVLLRFAVENAELSIEVEDTGKGIAPEIVQQLFQPFATHGKAHGTGLGLSIAKKIVDDHGGRIWATSAPEKGATFSVRLPLAPTA